MKHVLVTGASSGIGRASALRAARDGARVSLLARRLPLLEEVASEAKGAFFAACDVADAEAVERAFAAAVEANGPIHAFVACSGVGGPNAPGPDDRFDEIVRTNLYGTYHCVRAAQRHLAEGPDPRHIVVIASVLARFGVPGYTGYCASKAALLGMVKALALELAPVRVQVNAVCPGWVDTAMAWDGIDGMAAAMGVSREEAHLRAMSAVPAGRMSRPEEIAGLVAWLCGADAVGVTGQGLDINGGAWMG